MSCAKILVLTFDAQALLFTFCVLSPPFMKPVHQKNPATYSNVYFLPGEAGPPVLAIWSGPGSFSLNFSNATLISPILCLSLKLAVFRRYLDMGAVLGLGFGPRFLGPCLACNE